MGGDDRSGRDELEAQVAAERASAEHWRALAERRSEALAELRRRPSVRAVLLGDRATRRARDAARRAAGQGRAATRGWSLRVAALATRPALAGRRARLDAALARPTAPGAPAAPPTSTVDTVVFELPTTEHLATDGVARLEAVLAGRAGAAAAVPLVLHPRRPLRAATPHDLLVRAAGVAVELDGGVPVLRALGAGDRVGLDGPPVAVPAGLGACLVVDRAALDSVGGWPALPDPDAAAAVLCARLAGAGHTVVLDPTTAVLDHRPVAGRAGLTRPVDPTGPAWRAAVEASGAALRRLAAPAADGGRRFALTTAVPSAKIAERWGDWHLAHALADALRHLGHEAEVRTADRRDDLAGRAADVHLVLRGLQPVRRTPGQAHVLWIISHPEAVTAEECDAADLVLVASERFAEHLRAVTTTPVEVFLQATDQRRFRPVPPRPGHRHDVLVVAKTREVRRPIVDRALDAGLRPAIYGSGWEGQVDPALVVADHVANADLPALYAGAGVVLNDHWETMRAWGFVSNRLFDVLACGRPIISDPVDGVEALFGGAVAEVATADELRTAVETTLGDPAAAAARAEAGRRLVLASHTFDHRAAELLRLLDHHGAC
jgi:glycosyltransferase involved in cell wall biosynthesis